MKEEISVNSQANQKRRKLIKAGLALPAALSTGVWAPSIASAADEIPIGVVVGLTGAGADFGRDALRAFKLVADRVNRTGGIKSLGGAQIKLLVADHQTDLRVASSETERLITRENVLGILGWAASGPARVGSEVSERYSVPSIDTSVDYKLTERGLKYFYRAAINSKQTCERGIDFLVDLEKNAGLQIKRVAILHEDSAFGTGAGDVYKAAIERNSRWQLVDRISYTAGYEILPEDLRLAVLDLISYYMKNDSAVHAQRLAMPNTMQVEYLTSTNLPAHIKRILDLYTLSYN